MSKYDTCSSYCSGQGRQCLGSWEDTRDDCKVKSNESCTTRFYSTEKTSDAICQCSHQDSFSSTTFSSISTTTFPSHYEQCGNKSQPEVLESTSFDYRFPASNIFKLEEEATQNYWLAKHNSLDNQGFTLDLHCSTKLTGINVKNTHNSKSKDRATRRFVLEGRRSTSDSWSTLLEKELEDSRQQTSPPVQHFQLEEPREVRYLRFQLKEYWGAGGGLQYFAVEANQQQSCGESEWPDLDGAGVCGPCKVRSL